METISQSTSTKKRDELFSLINKTIPHHLLVMGNLAFDGRYDKAKDELEQLKKKIKELDKEMDNFI